MAIAFPESRGRNLIESPGTADLSGDTTVGGNLQVSQKITLTNADAGKTNTIDATSPAVLTVGGNGSNQTLNLGDAVAASNPYNIVQLNSNGSAVDNPFVFTVNNDDIARIGLDGTIDTDGGLNVRGSAIISGNLQVGGSITDLNSNLILSSAIGSIIASSGSLDFPNTDKAYHIRSVNGDLILSSSNTSKIIFSGNIETKGAGTLTVGGNTTFNSNVILAQSRLFYWTSYTQMMAMSNGTLRIAKTNGFTGSVVDVSTNNTFTIKDITNNSALISFGAINGVTGSITAPSSSLVLSSSAGSSVVISGTLELVDTAKPYTFRTPGSPMIFSGGANDGVGAGYHQIFSGNTRFTGLFRTESTQVALGNIFTSGEICWDGNNGNYYRLFSDVNGRLAHSCRPSGSYVGMVAHIDKIGYYGIGPMLPNNPRSAAGKIDIYIGASGSVLAPSSSLLFSSSVSRADFSASIRFPETDQNYHIAAQSGHLILSSSAGSVIAASASLDFTNTDKAYHIRAVNSDLILSSSSRSLIQISGGLRVGSPAGGAHLSSSDGDLILKGGGSTTYVVVSGSLIWQGNLLGLNAATSYLMWSSAGRMISPTNGVFRYMTNNLVTGSCLGFTSENRVDFKSRAADRTFISIGVVNDVTGSITAPSSSLILSSSAGSEIVASASLEFPTTDKAYHIRANNSDLILSGTTIKISGNLVGNQLTSTGNIIAGANNKYNFSTRSNITSPANGTIRLQTNNDLTGTVIGFATNNRLDIKDFSNASTLLSLGAVDGISGSISAPSSHLVLSSSAGSRVAVSGNLATTQNIILSKAASAAIQVDLDEPSYTWQDLKGDMRYDYLGANAPTLTAFMGGAVRRYAFTVGDKIDCEFHIPHDFVPTDVFSGSHLYIHPHWSHNGTAISGAFVGTMAYTYAKGHQQAVFGAEKTLVLTDHVNSIGDAPQYQHRIPEVQLSVSGGGASQLDSYLVEVDGVISLNWTQTTLPTITGGSPNEPFIFYVDIHYLSRNIGTKQKMPNFYV